MDDITITKGQSLTLSYQHESSIDLTNEFECLVHIREDLLNSSTAPIITIYLELETNNRFESTLSAKHTVLLEPGLYIATYIVTNNQHLQHEEQQRILVRKSGA